MVETCMGQTYTFCVYTVIFWDNYNVFWNFYLTILFKNAKLNIKKKKKKKKTQLFQNFGAVGKGQTNFFLGLMSVRTAVNCT